MVQSIIGEISIWEQSGREIFTGSITDNVLIGTKQNTGGEKLFVVGNTKIEGDVEITGTINATINANTINISDNNINNDFYLVFTDDSGDNRTLQIDKSSSPLTYNPVNNRLTVSGNVFANFWGNLTGTASLASTITTTSTSDNVGYYIVFGGNHATGANTIYANANLNYNPSTNTLTGGIFNGTSFSGNAGTATQLQSGRNINGVYFDGTANIQTIIGGTNINITTNSTINLDTVLTGLTSITSTDFIGNLTGTASSSTQITVIDATLNNSDFRLTSISNTPSTYNQLLYTDLTYNPQTNILKVGKIDNCFALTSSGSNLPILFIDHTATGKQFLYNNANFYYNPTLAEFLLQGNTTTQNINCNNLTMTSTDTGSSANPELILYRNSSSPASGDYLGQIQFKGKNSNNGDEIYAKITGKIRDETLGTEDGLIETAIKGNGSFTIVSRQRDDELQLLNGCGLSVDGKIEGLNDCVIEGDTGIGMAVSTNPLVPLHVIGTSADPTSNGLDGICQIATNTGQNDNKLCLGVVNGDHSWLQAYKYTTAFAYGNLCLNPAGGNVAIGVNLSSWNLRVNEDAHFGDALDNVKYGMVQIVRPGNQGTKFHLSFIRSGHTISGMGFLGNSDVFGIQNQATNNTATAGIFIDAGKIGINQTAPVEALHVNGTQIIRTEGFQTILRMKNHLRTTGQWNFFTNYSASFDNLHIQNDGGLGGGVFIGPGQTAWNSMSDDRLKHNEVEITNGLDVIMKMKPQFYDRSSEMLDADFNGNLDELNIKYIKESGFIAQEVYEIPELRHIVDTGNDPEMPFWSIIYQQIIPYNTSAIQQLNNKVIKLEEENTYLKNKIIDLENNLELIMQHLDLI